MATVTGTSSTPNPDAMKFSLDTRLEGMRNVTDVSSAAGDPFAEAVFAAPGVAAVFSTADFVTVTRQPGAEWAPIATAVEAAVVAHL
ncbi:MAG: NifU N-terminal domain-containing protein [Acidobacteria bacterium]|nr:NifU N-terminal domain-containing protein [Acidobacteriota bacterium]